MKNIKNNVTATYGANVTDVATAFKILSDAFVNDPELDEQDKQELIENLDFLSESVAMPEEKRRHKMIAAATARIAVLAAAATKAGQLWQEWGPILAQVLPAHGH